MRHMRRCSSSRAVIASIVITLASSAGAGQKPDTSPADAKPNLNDPNRYLNAVREFADNVLKYGRDTYGPKHTPLFVDGLNVNTHEPVKWIAPNGDRWILSNLASQQNLFRTLDGLTRITGDAKYKQAAMDAIKYAFDSLRSPNGLFYWGHTTAYDASADNIRSGTFAARGGSHALKLDYPYYELMWEVDPNETKKSIEAFWSAHVIDWSNLDFDRYALFNDALEEPWNHEYKRYPTFFKSKKPDSASGTWTGTSLIHAGTTLYRLSHEKRPLIWSKRLAERFIDTRHPKTGISYESYTYRFHQFGDDLKEHFNDPYTRHFPQECFDINMYYYYGENVTTYAWMSMLLVGEMLGKEGKEFKQWSLEEFTAMGKASYRKEDNSFIPILTDGTSLEGYEWKEAPGTGSEGMVVKPLPADMPFFWGYSVAYRITGDEFMWEMVRNIALGNNFGDIGQTPAHAPELRTETSCSDVYGLLGFLQLYEKTNKPEHLNMARRIGDNILLNKFHMGFFVPSKKHIYTRFDCLESLVLLRLDAAMENKTRSVPRVWPSVPLFVPPYRYKEQGIDRLLIYTLSESSEPPLSLQEAAAIGDVNLVKNMIENGTDVDSLDDSFMKTALHRAAMSGHKNVAELLLAQGAGVDARDGGCQTPLHYAAEKGHKEIAELLITNGADVNAKNNEGQTPLDIALRRNRQDIVDLLIPKGATIESIHVAARIGDVARVRAFLEQGIDVNAKDKDNQTALHVAAVNKQKDIAELLIGKGADVNAKGRDGYTPLFYAIWTNDANMVELLASKGADTSYTPEKSYPPLHWAVWQENLEIVKALLDHGAKWDVKDQDGWTAFRYAVSAGNRDMVELFLVRGADVSGIHLAACVGDLARVKRLAEEGADVNAQDELGWTPLYWAASMGRDEVGEFLLGKGARADIRTKEERTALHQAAYAGSVRLAELLISNGADVNAHDKRGSTPLHGVAWAGHQEVAKLLIAKGADVNARRTNGRTPLHRAAMAGHKELVEVLVDEGADVNAKDRQGRTALDLAEQRGHTEIAELLHKQTLVHDVAITNMSAPSDCVRGDTVSVVVTVQNQGDYSESPMVTLISVTDGMEIESQSVTSSLKSTFSDTKPDLILTGPSESYTQYGNYPRFGDVNGDGYEDLLVAGASRFDNERGRLYLYYGGSDMDDQPDKIFTGKKAGDLFGEDAYLADVNGDGYSDIVTCACRYNNGQGRVYIFYGGPDIGEDSDIILDGEPGTHGAFGLAITAGDLNDDGYDDVIITASSFRKKTGRVYLFYGGDPMDTTVDLTFDGENENDRFGRDINNPKMVGDVNGDGYNDLLISTRTWNFYEGVSGQGRAYLYYGGPGTSMDSTCDKIFTGENERDDFGVSGCIFDINNDGFGDVIIGARGYNNGQGRVYLYWGGQDMDTVPDQTFDGERDGQFGCGLDAGYVNGDEYGDFIVTAPYYAGKPWSGKAYLFYGGTRESINTSCDKTFTLPTDTRNWTQHVALGDLHNDNYPDVAIGGCMYNNGQGRVWIYHGVPGDSTQLKFDWDTANASPGKHTLRATIAPIEGEEDTADNTMTVEVEVKASSG